MLEKKKKKEKEIKIFGDMYYIKMFYNITKSGCKKCRQGK
jgi:hypothetical protein